MNRSILILCLLTISTISRSQTKALTETGREVILYEDGTWKYSQDSSKNEQSEPDSIRTNNNKYAKTNGATFLVKSTVLNVGVFINPAKWTFSSHSDNEKNPEFRFSLKTAEGYVMMVTERTQIDLENLRKIALLNARKASADVKETLAEYRTVNNRKILCLRFQGTIKGIKFVYFGYYYSNANGTVQLLSYSSQQFFDTIQKDMESFLNGLVEIEK